MVHYAVITEAGDLEFDFAQQQRAFCLRTMGAGVCVDVEIREHRAKRSDRQNRALWALLNAWCKEADQGWRPDDLKDAVMGITFGTIEVTQPLTGQVVKVPARERTSQLSVTDFCKVIEAILELAAEQDIYLMAPDEFRLAKEQAAKKAAKKQAKAA